MEYQTQDLLNNGRCPRCGRNKIVVETGVVYCLSKINNSALSDKCLYHFTTKERAAYIKFLDNNGLKPQPPENMEQPKGNRGRKRAFTDEEAESIRCLFNRLRPAFETKADTYERIASILGCNDRTIRDIVLKRLAYK